MKDTVEEELEPLFDYKRVQPFSVISLDDDSLDSPPITCKKKKKLLDSAVENKDKTSDVIHVIDDDDEEDEDWLPPPPKVTDYKMFEEDSILKKLRLKKQELAELAQSAKDFLLEIEENARRDLAAADSSKRNLNDSIESAAEGGVKQPARPVSEREKIVITVQDRNEKKPFRVFMDDKFEKFFKLYAEKFKLDLQKLVFCFDGEKVSPLATPKDLEMEDNDIIEVHVKKS